MPPESLVAGSSELLPLLGGEKRSLRRGVSLPRQALVPDPRGARLFDLIGATFALLALMPVMIAAAVAIKIDSPGPVLFRQRRSGFDQSAFTILKFRTMRVDDSERVVQARRGDRRVTTVGSLLRRSSLDELPQLVNVLRGEMSLVGPRPHALCHDQQYRGLIGNYGLRHSVKPGMTGWAQVNGLRGETADLRHMAARVESDLWYIEHRSLLLDLRILGRTTLELLKFDAY